jgi:phenylalanyl-tRNA synthetase beta chain
VKHLRQGQSVEISLDGAEIGTVGRLSDEIAASYKFREPVYIAEIDLELALSRPVAPAIYQPLAIYPGISRDVSFNAKRSVTYASIREAIVDQQAELCRSVEFVDVYEGKGLADDERSITLRLEYRSDERTLVEAEAEALHERLVSTAEQKLGINRRF